MVMTRGSPVPGATRRRVGRAGGLIVLAAAALFLGRAIVYPYPAGPEQPLPFSHRIHAGVRGISCLFCHDAADRSQNAGMPEVSKCLLCHNVIITELDPIRELRGYSDRRQPISWVRVYRLPDYAHFDHQMHLAAGVDCGECHGDVKQMDRIIQAMPMEMGFCVDCHRKNDAPVDCTLCHY